MVKLANTLDFAIDSSVKGKVMKKVLSLLLVLLFCCSLFGCTNDTSNIEVDYGSSQQYTAEDLESAVDVIISESRRYDVKRIAYISDSESNENYEICLEKGYVTYSEAITFNCEFYIEGEGLLNNHWTLARKDKGKWVSLFKPF